VRVGDTAEQIYAIDLAGGDAKRITNVATDASNPRFRPDGKAESVPIRRGLEDPALITQGELDFRVPVNESIITFKLLQRQNVPRASSRFRMRGTGSSKGRTAAGTSRRSTRGSGSI
jgi:hypothetical protein